MTAQDRALIFYDTETTGINKDFSQIIQCGSIKTDLKLNTLASQNISSSPLPWIIPQPKAFLTNKKTHLFNINNSHYQMIKDIHLQWREWTQDIEGIFISYNGHSFDDELLRRQFFSNLFEPYITNTNGNSRLDLMLMMHNIATFFQSSFEFPLFNDDGRISYKLEDIAKFHGIRTDDAHDAEADCKLMIEVCKILSDKSPEIFNSFLKISSKQGVMELLRSSGFLALGEIFRRHVFSYPVVFCGSDQNRPNDIALFDLSYDPDDIIDLDFIEINKIIQSGGRDTPIKKYKINKTIPICHSNLIENKNIFDISFDELNKRALKIQNNQDFIDKVSQALSDRMVSFKDPEHVEGSIYSGGFASFKDKDLMQQFHLLIDDPDNLIKISRNFEDDRYRIFAERIISYLYPSQTPEDIQNRYKELIDERLSSDGPWGSLKKAIDETESLLEDNDDSEKQDILNSTLKYLKSIRLS